MAELIEHVLAMSDQDSGTYRQIQQLLSAALVLLDQARSIAVENGRTFTFLSTEMEEVPWPIRHSDESDFNIVWVPSNC